MIDVYPKLILGGHEPACRNQHLLAQRTLSDLDASVKRGSHLYFDEDAAGNLCDFVEKYLTVFDHERKRRIPFKLLPWQRYMYSYWSGWRIRDSGFDPLARSNGSRRVRRIFLLTSKGSGKSILFAGFLCWMMLENHEFFGAVCGSTEPQARRPYNEFRNMLASNPGLADSFECIGGRGRMPGEIRTIEDGYDGVLHTIGNHSQYENISGPIVDFACAEEYHTHKTKDLLDQVDAGTKQSLEPLTLVLSNAGVKQTGPAWEEYRHGRKILRGSEPWRDDYLPLIYEVDDGANLETAWEIEDRESEDDPKIYTAAAETMWKHGNPSYGVTTRKDYQAKIMARADSGLESEKRECDRLLFSKFGKRSGVNAWIGDDLWSEIVVKEDPVDEEGNAIDLSECPCWLGIDLGESRAFSALCQTWLLPNGRAHSMLRFYLPADNLEDRIKFIYKQPHLIDWGEQGYVTMTDGRKTDWTAIADDIVQICNEGRVQGIAYDDFQADNLMTACIDAGLRCEKGTEEDAYDYPGIIFVDHPQGGGYQRNNPRKITMAKGVNVLEERILAKPPRVTVEHNPLMNWMVDCTVLKIVGNPQSKRRWLIPDPVMGKSAFIDGPVAWLMSCNLMDWRPEDDVYSVDDAMAGLAALDAALRGKSDSGRSASV